MFYCHFYIIAISLPEKQKEDGGHQDAAIFISSVVSCLMKVYPTVEQITRYGKIPIAKIELNHPGTLGRPDRHRTECRARRKECVIRFSGRLVDEPDLHIVRERGVGIQIERIRAGIVMILCADAHGKAYPDLISMSGGRIMHSHFTAAIHERGIVRAGPGARRSGARNLRDEDGNGRVSLVRGARRAAVVGAAVKHGGCENRHAGEQDNQND